MLLAIYLNDHLAGATAGRDLARRSAASNDDSPYGEFLTGLAIEIDEDRDSLLELMRRLEVRVDRLKVAGGWAAEKAGRLKLNGRLLGYSPLSRMVELEGLTLGVRGKLGLWRALAEIAPTWPSISSDELSHLSGRAQDQLDALETHRLRAAVEAFG